jgi:hypothetical protein
MQHSGNGFSNTGFRGKQGFDLPEKLVLDV